MTRGGAYSGLVGMAYMVKVWYTHMQKCSAVTHHIKGYQLLREISILLVIDDSRWWNFHRKISTFYFNKWVDT